MRRCVFLLVLLLAGFPAALAAQDPPPAPVAVFDIPTLELLINIRADMDLLVNQQLGAERPTGWSGLLDVNNPQLALLTRLDLELLAGWLLAPDRRPPGWFGAIPGTPYLIARDIRHDLEALADAVGQPNVRPNGWVGGDPLIRCERAVQALVTWLESSGSFVLTVDFNSPDFCRLAELQASQYAESLASGAPAPSGGVTSPAISEPLPADAGGGAAGVPPGGGQITGALALGFLNRYATEHIGLIPVGTAFTPVAASRTEFSRMTLIRGQGFELFIDYRDSTLTDADFAALPDVNGVQANPVCEADWCQPVTFTVGSPAARRPLPGQVLSVSGFGGGPGARVKVPVEHLIIYYDGQDASNTVVVRMQLCAKPTSQPGNTCETVSQVLAPGGAPLTAVGSVSGLPQFRLPYGYSAHTLYANSYYMTDVWIAAPGQKR